MTLPFDSACTHTVQFEILSSEIVDRCFSLFLATHAWLEANPVQDSVDISFLRGEVIRIKEILESSLAEEQQQRELLGLGGTGVSRGGNWRGSVPYLRLILCLTQDDIKFAFLRRADAQSRQELDARNSENR